MALKILNPGLRPLGMFDLDDTFAGALNGGEYVELQNDDFAAEAYAADVGQLGDATTPTNNMVNFTATSKTQVDLTVGATVFTLGGLADEGGDEYGTLFGSLIGQNAGRATQVPGGGAVVIGPTTDRASGKVTVWHAPGLYGVTDQDATLDAATANDSVFGTAGTGVLTTDPGAGPGANGNPCAVYVGAMSDTSLVSTTATAVGETATTEYHAVYLIGVGA